MNAVVSDGGYERTWFELWKMNVNEDRIQGWPRGHAPPPPKIEVPILQIFEGKFCKWGACPPVSENWALPTPRQRILYTGLEFTFSVQRNHVAKEGE